MISMISSPANVRPTTSLVVLFQLGEEECSDVVITVIIKDIPRLKKELALSASSFVMPFLGARTRLDRVKHSREDRTVTIGYFNDQPGNDAKD